MNKRIDLLNLGGFPLTQGTLDFMQESYREAFKGLAGIAGDKVIITGVEVVGSTISDGWVSYDGELIKFIGGGISTDVYVEETSTEVTFQDNEVRPVYYTKVMKPGTPGDFPFTDLKRLDKLGNIWLTGDLKQVDCDGAYIAANFDGTGLGINERTGWAVCNGNNGTINRGGRISVGYDEVLIDPVDNVWDVAYNTIGGTGGEKEHLLTIDEMPAHSHSFSTGGDSAVDNNPAGKPLGRQNDDARVSTTTTSSAGGGLLHNNMPPFIVTLYLQKL